jgi:hypothetical protein
MDLEERLSRLEQSNRRLKQIICLLILLPFAILPLMGAGREEKIALTFPIPSFNECVCTFPAHML